jgi:di/tricarboxylate transporter
VPPHSPLIGLTVGEFLFNERLGLVPLAVHRHPGVHAGDLPHVGSTPLDEVRLTGGDVLLVSGPPQRLRELASGELLQVLGSIDYRRPRYRKAILAVLIFGASVAAAGSGFAPPAIAGLVGLLAMIATRCVDVSDAFRIEWRVVLLIGSLLALGLAMEKSGAGELLAQALVPLAETVGPRGMIFVVMLLTVVLSAPMSNQAAALVVLPVAINVANILGLEPRAFAIATCLAASCSFMTPLEPSAALVYGPGHYRFADFLRAGTPLTLVLLVLLTWLVPIYWPL